MTSTETNLEAVQRKITGLLAKAERAGSPEEAEAFAAKAEQMMVKYSIDAAMLGSKKASSEELLVHRVEVTGIYALPTTMGLSGICSALGTVRYWITGTSTSKAHTGNVAGYQGDVEMAVMLWNSLALQAQTAMKVWAKDRDFTGMTSFQKFAERRTFLTAFWGHAAIRVQQTFSKAVVEADEQFSGGASLALIDRNAAVDTLLPADLRTSKGSRTKSGSYDAMAAGHQAGGRADLGHNRMAGSRSAIAR